MSGAVTTTAEPFLEAMGAGVAVVAVRDDGGPLAVAVPSVASYSIDPPSVMVSLPGDVATRIEPIFGVSLLAAGQADLAAELWHRPRRLEDLVVRDDAPLVPDAYAHIACRPRLVSEVAGAWLVVGEVTEVTLRPGRPLIRLDADFYG